MKMRILAFPIRGGFVGDFGEKGRNKSTMMKKGSSVQFIPARGYLIANNGLIYTYG